MTDTTTHASAAPTTPDSTPVEWHTADADDRWPGRWTAHTASVHALMDIARFRFNTCCACRYDSPPSYNRRDTPARPWMSIGKKIPFIATNEPQKWILPSFSLRCLPVAFGYQ